LVNREEAGRWQPPTGRYNAAVDLVDRHPAEGRGAQAAFVDPDRRITYAELKDRTDRFATALRRLGVVPEQRVALILLDTVDFPVAFWGAIKAGVAAVPLNTLLTTEQWCGVDHWRSYAIPHDQVKTILARQGRVAR
jgi:4-hydroxybenzoate-CoA ligase